MVAFHPVLALTSLTLALTPLVSALAITPLSQLDPASKIASVSATGPLSGRDGGAAAAAPAAPAGLPGSVLTNAQRLAKGLSPLPPTRRATAAKRQSSQSFNGASQVYLAHVRNPSDGSDLGVVGIPTDNGLINIDTNAAHALLFSFTPSQSTPFPITPMDSNGSTFGGPHALLAAVPHKTSSGSTDLNQGSSNFSPIGAGQQGSNGGLINIDLGNLLGSSSPLSTLLGGSTSNSGSDSGSDTGSSSPLGGSGSGSNPESAIWTFKPSTSTLLAHYTNSDGSTVPASIVTGGSACQHLVCLTADVDAFRQAFGSDAQEINLVVTAL